MTTFGAKQAERLRNIEALLSESSGEKNNSALINNGQCLLTGIKILTNGVTDVTVTVFDNTEASGAIVDKFIVPAAERYGGAMYGLAAIMMHNGIFVEMSGSGGSYYCFYAPVN